jgi:trehalose-6-phosphate synthase
MKYIEHGYEELYDILHDPHEIENLVKNPNYQIQLKEMRKKYSRLSKKFGASSEQYIKGINNSKEF